MLLQALSRWEADAIAESVSIDSPIDDLVAAFDENKPLQYLIGVDVAPAVSWKAPYREISVGVAAQCAM